MLFFVVGEAGRDSIIVAGDGNGVGRVSRSPLPEGTLSFDVVA